MKKSLLLLAFFLMISLAFSNTFSHADEDNINSEEETEVQSTDDSETDLDNDVDKDKESFTYEDFDEIIATVEGLTEDQIFALKRSLNNAVKSGLEIELTAEILQSIVDGDYDARQINALTKALEEEAKFKAKAERFQQKYEETGNEKFLEKSEWFLAKAESQKGKFLAKIDRFESSEIEESQKGLSVITAEDDAGSSARDATRELAENTAKISAKKAARDLAKKSAKIFARNEARKLAKNAAKIAAKEEARKLAKDLVQDVLNEIKKDAKNEARENREKFSNINKGKS